MEEKRGDADDPTIALSGSDKLLSVMQELLQPPPIEEDEHPHKTFTEIASSTDKKEQHANVMSTLASIAEEDAKIAQQLEWMEELEQLSQKRLEDLRVQLDKAEEGDVRRRILLNAIDAVMLNLSRLRSTRSMLVAMLLDSRPKSPNRASPLHTAVIVKQWAEGPAPIPGMANDEKLELKHMRFRHTARNRNRRKSASTGSL